MPQAFLFIAVMGLRQMKTKHRDGLIIQPVKLDQVKWECCHVSYMNLEGNIGLWAVQQLCWWASGEPEDTWTTAAPASIPACPSWLRKQSLPQERENDSSGTKLHWYWPHFPLPWPSLAPRPLLTSFTGSLLFLGYAGSSHLRAPEPAARPAPPACDALPPDTRLTCSLISFKLLLAWMSASPGGFLRPLYLKLQPLPKIILPFSVLFFSIVLTAI